MITEYVRYQIEPAQTDQFEADYGRAADVLANSPYCIDYELSRCVEDPTQFILQIHWTSSADHLEGFRASAEFPEFLRLVRPYMSQLAEMRHYQPTAVQGTGQGGGKVAASS